MESAEARIASILLVGHDFKGCDVACQVRCTEVK